jgi:hypothetical protein
MLAKGRGHLIVRGPFHLGFGIADLGLKKDEPPRALRATFPVNEGAKKVEKKKKQ